MYLLLFDRFSRVQSLCPAGDTATTEAEKAADCFSGTANVVLGINFLQFLVDIILLLLSNKGDAWRDPGFFYTLSMPW